MQSIQSATIDGRIDLTRTSRKESGAVMLEFILVFPVYIAIILATIDLARLSFHAVSTQYFVSSIARSASLGAYADSAALAAAITKQLGLYGVHINPVNVSACLLSDPNYCPGPNATASVGQANDWILITINQPIRMLTGGWSSTIKAYAVVKNEP